MTNLFDTVEQSDQGESVGRDTNPNVSASEYANLEKARFFVIKSYSEEDVYKV